MENMDGFSLYQKLKLKRWDVVSECCDIYILKLKL